MTLNQLLKAADLAYSYTDTDKAIIRQMAKDDKAGLIAALESDPLIHWVAYENGLTDRIDNKQ